MGHGGGGSSPAPGKGLSPCTGTSIPALRAPSQARSWAGAAIIGGSMKARLFPASRAGFISCHAHSTELVSSRSGLRFFSLPRATLESHVAFIAGRNV